MDELDRRILNELQRGFPICERPFAEVAERIGCSEGELIRRVETLLADNTLTRFGPMYQAERLGGGLTLAAMQIPEDDFERVAELVNAHPQVAHNYARDHLFNMWFVLATERQEQIAETLSAIEQESGYPVFDMPKQEEFFIGLRFDV